MTTVVRVTYANGVLTPQEPLDLEEGRQVTVSIDGVSPSAAARGESLDEMFERLRKSVPPQAWDQMPADGAKNYKHYLYGHPKA
ncbi:MAG: antitoxin family protein [Acidimicrobiaceae bacterium]|nr:antitoxin family protein [Acidimicrobiaceae bacterium]